jgi:hypothetical protein
LTDLRFGLLLEWADAAWDARKRKQKIRRLPATGSR